MAERAVVLRRAADVLQAQLPRFCALLVKEAFKTWGDAVAEVREAVDFLRYYADEAERIMKPFGGEGSSGTGPKAGGPHFLQRFCTEQNVTVNTTSAGGNVALMA